MRREDQRRKKMNERCKEHYLNGFFIWAGLSTYDDLFDTVEMPFEGQTFCVSKEYDKILRQLYGDYMALPPESSRVTHKPLKVVLDLSKSAEEN